MFSDSCNFVHDVRITAAPSTIRVSSSVPAVLLPEISYTSPVSDRHREPYIIRHNPFLDDDIPEDGSIHTFDSPDEMSPLVDVTNQDDEPEPLGSPIRLEEPVNRTAHRHLGLPAAAPLYLAELKGFQKKYLGRITPSPSVSIQELSYDDRDASNDQHNLSLVCVLQWFVDC